MSMKKRGIVKRLITLEKALAPLCFLLFLSVAGCSPGYFPSAMDGEYDSTHIYTKDIHRVLGEVAKSIYRVETSTTFKVGDDKSTLKSVGMAFSLDNRHLLTAKHVTAIDHFQVETPHGLLSLPIPPDLKLEETTAIVLDDGSRMPLRVVYRDEELDFAVLLSEKEVQSPPYAIGNSDDFKIVSQIILPANFQTGLSIRLGYITQLDFVRYGSAGQVAVQNEDIFGISAVVSEGDSGSPILLLRDGKMELGGLVSFIVLPARGLGYGLKINPILEKLMADQTQKAWLEPLLR